MWWLPLVRSTKPSRRNKPHKSSNAIFASDPPLRIVVINLFCFNHQLPFFLKSSSAAVIFAATSSLYAGSLLISSSNSAWLGFEVCLHGRFKLDYFADFDIIQVALIGGE